MRTFLTLLILLCGLSGREPIGLRADESPVPTPEKQAPPSSEPSENSTPETPSPDDPAKKIHAEQTSPEVDPDILYSVKIRDNEMGIGGQNGERADEIEKYYFLLDRAKKFSLESQQKAAQEFQEKRRETYPKLKDRPKQKFPAFADLFLHPEEYRGKLVTLSGWSWRIVELHAEENKHGIETLYEIWLYTSDSQRNPAVVICTSLPEGIPRGDELVDGVTVTGYFFKMYGYEAQDTTRIAPLILAKTVQWNPAAGGGVTIPSWLIALIIGLVVVMIVSIWRTMSRDRRITRNMQKHKVDTEPDFNNLG